MSSRSGPRAMGTDGTDFRHRQRVALHYQISVTNKFRLKLALALHFSLYVLMFLRLLEDILDKFAVDWAPLERLKVPDPHLWEYLWMFSLLPMTFAFIAMPRNRDGLMTKAYYGFFLTGIVPIAIGAGVGAPELIVYISEPQREKREIMGFPFVVLLFMFLAAAVQIHGFTMYFVAQLIKAWRPATVAPKPATVANGEPVADEAQNGQMTRNSASNENLRKRN